MKSLKIEWQRLLVEEETCPRCGGTEAELGKAVNELEARGIKVEFIKRKLTKAEFDKTPQASNRVIINGKPMEAWLNAGTGSSPCCDACGDANCRTVELNGQVYETIPAELIVKASLETFKKGAK